MPARTWQLAYDRSAVARKDHMMKFNLVAAAAVLLMTAPPAAAQQQYPNPYKVGNFWTVTGVHVKPGGTLKIANDIADVWQKQQEFAKSKGWIKSFMVLSDPYPRESEPSLYLVTVSDRLATPDESDARGLEIRAFMKMTGEQLQQAAAGRAEFSSPGSTELLREWVRR